MQVQDTPGKCPPEPVQQGPDEGKGEGDVASYLVRSPVPGNICALPPFQPQQPRNDPQGFHAAWIPSRQCKVGPASAKSRHCRLCPPTPTPWARGAGSEKGGPGGTEGALLTMHLMRMARPDLRAAGGHHHLLVDRTPWWQTAAALRGKLILPLPMLTAGQGCRARSVLGHCLPGTALATVMDPSMGAWAQGPSQ